MAEQITRRWDQLVENQPSAPALFLSATQQTVTRAELNTYASQLAKTLQFSAYPPGSVVAFQLPNGLDWLATFIAAQRHNLVVLPLDPDLPNIAVQQSANAARAAVVVGAKVPLTMQPCIHPPSACLIKATSGTTGKPKHFVFADQQMLADARQICQGMGLVEDDRNFALIPFGHSYGLGNLVMPLLDIGIPIICGQSIFPSAIRQDIETYGATVFPAVPPLLRALLESGEAAQLPACLRLIISAGSSLLPQLAADFSAVSGRWIHNFYGSSETGGIAYDQTGQLSISGSAIGTALPGVKLTISASSRRLRVSSPAVWNSGKLPMSPHRDGFLLQDRGKLDEKNRLVLLGRSDRQVKIAGRRVSLVEVENAIKSVCKVQEVWATTIEGPGGEPRLAVAIVAEHKSPKWIAAIREALPRWKCPSVIRVLNAFPTNARGKIDHPALSQVLSAVSDERG